MSERTKGKLTFQEWWMTAAPLYGEPFQETSPLTLAAKDAWDYCESFDERDRLIEELAEALRKAIETISIWHGASGWEIYERWSPEMQPVTKALAAYRKWKSS